jgi:IS5 family transposase
MFPFFYGGIMSFLALEASTRLKKNHRLLSISSLINWSQIALILGNVGRSGMGPGCYEPVMMVKALILQQWHSLSDPELEEALRVRLDFMLFTGFEGEVPDETTLCRFRGKLIELNLLEVIFKKINSDLEQQGLKINPSQGAVVDATIISSAARPEKQMDCEIVDRQEPVHVECHNPQLSCDEDARWLKKGNKSYFGYKGFIITDSEEGFIDHVHVTSANVSEMKELKAVMKGLEMSELYADKGYACNENREHLKSLNIGDGIMHKAARNRELTTEEKEKNKAISKKRFVVERCFGTLKRQFKFVRASYYTRIKVEGQMLLKAIVFNLLKAFHCKQNQMRKV